MMKIINGLPKPLYERFLDDFKRAYSEYPFATIAIVPTSDLASNLRRSLAMGGTPIAGTSITTLSEHTLFLFESFNRDEVIVNSFESEMILRKIIIGNKERLPLFFRGGALRKGFVSEARSFFGTLFDYQADYPACLGELQSPKSYQLAIIRDAYLDFLRENSLLDPHESMQWAKSHMASEIGRPISQLLFFGLNEPKPIEKDLILALIKKSEATVYYQISNQNDKVFSDDLGWLSPSSIETLNAREDGLTQLFLPNGAKIPLENIHLDSRQDPLVEMREVAARITGMIQRGIDPNSIAILLPVREKTGPLLRQVLEDFCVPANIGVAVSLSESPIVQSIFDVLGTVHHSFRREDVVRSLASPYLRFKFVHKGKEEALLSYEVDSCARDAGIIAGAEDWPIALDALAVMKKEEMASSEISDSKKIAITSQIERISKVRNGMDELIKILLPLDEDGSRLEHLTRLRTVLRRMELGKHLFFKDKKVIAKERKALRPIMESMAGMERSTALLGDESISLDEFIREVRDEVIGLPFIPDRKRRNAITVAGLRAAVLERYDHIFIVGMVDNEMPKLDISYPFASEEEARRMGVLTPKDILRQERYYFLMALLSAKKSVHISYSMSEGGKKLLPSPFVEDLRERFELKAYEQSDLSASRLKRQEILGRAIAGEPPRISELDADIDLDGICQRINAEELHRSGTYHSPYDGVLTSDEAIVRIMRDFHLTKAYSASALEAYAQCPFKYYLRYVLGFEPIPEVEDEVQAKEAGSLFHHVAFRFYSERRDAGKGKLDESEARDALERIRAIGSKELEAVARSGASWEAFQRGMLGQGPTAPGTLGIFIESEIDDPMPALQPRMFELAIGIKREPGEMDPSSVSKPVTIELGEGEPSSIPLKGAVDRVDMDERGRFFIIDYKTGKKVPTAKDVAEGRRLQIPLYIMATEKAFPGTKGIGGGYYLVRTRKDTGIVPVMGDAAYKDLFCNMGKRQCVNDEYSSILLSTRKRVQALIQGMMAARFPPSSLAEECGTNCDYFSICRFSELRLLEMEVD